MYVVIYAFELKPNQETKFIEAWQGLTSLIYKHEGSLGSRLHKKDALNYIAYAQWPNQNAFDIAGGNLPEEANYYRDSMKSACVKFEVLEKLEVVKDLLKQQQSE
ncbi:antibiotic biosynthesis monooxygenase family protein [Winogradskyella endarachnes]|uniref:Antibiotic biosynthesis monooxygenase n=1 Tax=Winogradskyella endarachnes TaxID=2681965 RepID=A0A6L6U9R2_9FLAO|nr:antibiotic biosynthesis monooxygenase [Winogradskyella endarachnes]MUU79025.1 antibiotic biosynthesis monooxygenase [Winogradskyella endarachnes]